MSFNLRPVSDPSPESPSPTSSTAHSPSSKPPPPSSMSSNGRPPRRPLSPNSLPFLDVDLKHAPDMPHRKYAAPLTGHDLMAMFPPAPPVITEMRSGPTSGYFQRQERAFFAKAGREIVRVRMEVDIQNGADPDVSPKTRGRGLWPTNPTHAHQSPIQSASAYPHPSGSRAPPLRVNPPVTSTPPYPNPSPSSHHPPNHYAQPTLRTPPHDSPKSGPKSEYQQDEYADDDAWRRPMPYAERRRAGKHTRRVIVRT